MDPQLLNHLLQLAAKTGDRLIVVDPATQRPFVLMGIAQYEALVGGGSPVVLSEPAPAAASAAFTPDPIVGRSTAGLKSGAHRNRCRSQR
jgi:hypothetical protein